MTRLAGGDPEMWRDILLTNRSAVLASLNKLDEQLAELRDLLETADAAGIEKLLSSAKSRREKTVGRRLRDPSITTE
jgi:prephenate dehydrogenase